MKQIRHQIFNVPQRWYNIISRQKRQNNVTHRRNNVAQERRNNDTTFMQRCFDLTLTLVKAILNPVGLVMIMDLQLDE